MKWWSSLLLVLLTVMLACPLYSADRIALVIGNGDYSFAPLRNPVNDARDMASVLDQLDFEVLLATNTDRRQMITTINDFSSKLEESDIALFYYAGHGMQIDGENYLIPVGVNIAGESDVEFEAVKASRVVAKMGAADSKLNIVVLDACRNNPFHRSFRSSIKGLARMDAPKGTIIAYATSPGSTAADGNGRNGIFTKHLLNALTIPELDIQNVFNEAGMAVMAETGDRQIPWTSITPIPRYYLAGGTSEIKDSTFDGINEDIETGSLNVTSSPSGARVYLNGTSIGKTPLYLKEQRAETVTLTIRKNGYISKQRTIRISAAQQTVIDVDLTPVQSTDQTPTVTNSPGERNYTLATASTGGTYYPVGVAISSLVRVKLQPQYKVGMSAINSHGSGENIHLLREGRAHFAILQGLFGYFAWNGKGPMKREGPQKDLRSITMLWQNVEQFIVHSDHASTGTISDLAGMKGERMGLGKRNSGTLGSNRLLLKNLGIDADKTYDLAYLGYGSSAEALQSGQISGMSTPAGIPTSAVARAFDALGDRITMLNFTKTELSKADGGMNLWTRHVIEAGTYPGQSKDIWTIAQPNFLAVRADVDEDAVYMITKTIYENLPFLRAMHKATHAMARDKALLGLPMPLHPGAFRYFKETGLTIPKRLIPGG